MASRSQNNLRSVRGAARRAAALGPALALTACAAVYPRYTTSARPAPPGMAQGGEISPPPDDVHRVAVVRAEVPHTTRDGRPWDDDAAPDPYVVIFRNGQEVLRSRTLTNAPRPEWDPARDYVDLRIADTDTLRVELRDDDTLTHDPIGLREFRGVPSDARNGGVWVVRLEGGSTVELQDTPPPPRLGMGVTYEYRHDALVVVAVEPAGPARAAGLQPGDRIVAIQGRPVGGFTENEVRDAMDRGAIADVALSVRRAGGAATEVRVRRDAVYPVR